MNKQLIHIIGAVLILSVFSACKKDETPDPAPVAPNSWSCEPIENIRQFFSFNTGTWWVYQEEYSGAYDTIFVTSNGIDPNSYYFECEIYSSHQGYYYSFWPEGAASSPSSNCPMLGVICDRCIKVTRSKYKPGDFVDEATCFIFLPFRGESDYNYNTQFLSNEIRVDSTYESYSVNNFNFGSTVKMFEHSTVMEGYQPTNHYFSRNVGLVRKELLFDNEIWNLVDYYIAP